MKYNNDSYSSLADIVESGQGGVADGLQESIYKEGMRVLNVLSEMAPAENEGMDAFGQAKKSLGELGHFYYNIGFAGEQSCGKSTVINSLLQYMHGSTSGLQ